MTHTPSTRPRVLLVEDTPDDAELIGHALRKAGFPPPFSLVEDEAGFLREIDLARPDVILCDYHLPGFSCERVLQLLEERRSPTPVVVVSQGISDQEAGGMIRRGAFQHVRKDRLGELAAVIARALGGAARG